MKTNTQKFMAVALAMLGLLITGQTRAALPNNAKVSTNVSKTDVQVAEPFQFDFTVTASKGTKVLLPATGDQLGEFDVLDTKDIADLPSRDSADQRIWTRRMTLESIVAGDLQIPALDIQVRSGNESQALETIRTKPISVSVQSLLEGRADPTKFHDIQSVVDVDIPKAKSHAWVLWTVGGLGFASIIAATVGLVARRKTWLTPAQWAQQELDALQSSRAMADNDSETITEELSTVLRDFLELQFEISTPVQTTNELLSEVHHRKILKTETTKRFGKLFSIADQAKFASLDLTASQWNEVFIEARSVITEASQYEPQMLENETDRVTTLKEPV